MNFGDKKVNIEVPDRNFLGLVSPHDVKGVTSEKSEVERALCDPIGNNGIEAFLKEQKKTVVVVDDYTRPTPVDRILRG